MQVKAIKRKHSGGAYKLSRMATSEKESVLKGPLLANKDGEPDGGAYHRTDSETSSIDLSSQGDDVSLNSAMSNGDGEF